MIELESVSKKFGATIALHETDLSIEAGRTTVLIGASGCGKVDDFEPNHWLA
jgi:osmoprotectant transport system ATP-binding protein